MKNTRIKINCEVASRQQAASFSWPDPNQICPERSGPTTKTAHCSSTCVHLNRYTNSSSLIPSTACELCNRPRIKDALTHTAMN